MKSIRMPAMALAAVLVALAMVISPARGAPEAQTNLLRNPDFESGTYARNGDTARQVPNEWAAWWISKDPPRYNPSELPSRIKSGLRAASVWENYRDIDGGLMQIVTNVTPGTVYRFTMWGHAWSTTDTSKTTSNTDVQMQIGIDPNGGDNPSSASIVWSGTLSAKDSYQLFSVDAAAKANQITVWVRGKTTYPVTQTDFYWDAGSLTAVGQAAAPTNTSAPSGGTTGGGTTGGGGQGGCTSNSVPSGSIQKATPQADGSVVHTVQRCETLIGIAVTYNVTLEDLRRLNSLQSDVLYVGQQLTVSGPVAPTAVPATPTPTPAQAAEVTQEVEQQEPAVEDLPGTICVMSYEDLNSNGIREPEEPKLSGVTFLVTDSGTASNVATYTTTGLDEPHCFTELLASTYTVTWTASGYAPTTEQSWIANVAPGATVSREFGVVGAEDAAENSDESAGGLPPAVLAGVAALGVIFLLTGIGAAGYFFLARRSQV